MNILHLCNDYANQKLYLELGRALSRQHVSQLFYVPVRTAAEVGRYQDDSLPNVKWRYSHIIRTYLKLFYRWKLNIKQRDLDRHVRYADYSLIHAHFLFSDGGLAHMIRQKHGLEYIVAVRNTDLNYFFRYALHLRQWGIEILLNAKRIIFISPTYQRQLLEKYVPKKYHEAILAKSHIVPNGVDEFWLRHRIEKPRKLSSPPRLLYVGEFTKNKNLDAVMTACERLMARGIDLTLTLVGEYGGYENEIMKRAARHAAFKTLPRINDKNELMRVYREHDIFIMTSLYETFGLVYIEALSQGLPIIYSRNQGIDGYFQSDEAGYAADAQDVNSIAEKIDQVIKNYDRFAANPVDLDRFTWDKIASRYVDIYRSTENPS